MFSLNDVISWGETSEPFCSMAPGLRACVTSARKAWHLMASPRGRGHHGVGSALARAARGPGLALAAARASGGGAGRPGADRGQCAARVGGWPRAAGRACHRGLNNIVHGLAWQAEVCHELDGSTQPRRARAALRPGEHRRPRRWLLAQTCYPLRDGGLQRGCVSCGFLNRGASSPNCYMPTLLTPPASATSRSPTAS